MKKLYAFIFVGAIIVLMGGVFLFARRAEAPTPTIAKMVTEKSLGKYTLINLSYPASSPTLYPQIYDLVSTTKADFLNQYGSISDTDAAYMHMGGDRVYDLDIATRIATSSKTVSYILEVYEFTGGAHGGTSVYTFTYDSKGQLVTPDRLFTAPYLERVAGLARPYFYDKLAELSQKQMIDSGTEPTIDNYGTWYLTDSTITYIFGQYAIGPYVIGLQEFPLDKSKIADILSPEFR